LRVFHKLRKERRLGGNAQNLLSGGLTVGEIIGQATECPCRPFLLCLQNIGWFADSAEIVNK
jgi:hypothetical protein